MCPDFPSDASANANSPHPKRPIPAFHPPRCDMPESTFVTHPVLHL